MPNPAQPDAEGHSLSYKKYQPQRHNANQHTERGLALLDKSIQRDGWIGAITVAADGETFDGSARLERVVDVMGESEPITLDIDGTRPVILRRTDIATADEPRAKRLAVAANTIASIDWNPDGALLAMLAADDEAIAQLIRNDDKAARAVLDAENEAGGGDAEAQIDRAAELQEKWGTELNQLWTLGKHKLLIADCTVRENVARVMQGEKADMVFTDPPYGVGYEYADTEDNPNDYESLANGFWNVCPAAPLKMLTVGNKWNNFWFDKKPNGFLVWFDKTKQSPSSVAYLCKSELMLIFGKVYERFAWDTIEIQQPRNDGLRDLHTCPKPLELWQKILEVQKGAMVVYDPFAGSGTTIIAAQNLSRRCYAMEISPNYAGVILERFSDAFPDIVIERIP